MKRALLLVMLLVAGCAAFQQTVDTSTTVFYMPGFVAQGSIAVLPADAGLANSLEFAHYRQKFESRLAAAGFSIEADIEKARYLALVAYGIDNGETAVVSTPVFGRVSGGYYVGDSYVMPTYGVVDVLNQSVTSFNRALAMDIVVAESFRQAGPVQKVYESRTKSQGACPVMVEVFDEMLEAMFTGFPAENARNRKHSIPAIINC